jgi:hypothetical protein
LSQDVQYCGNMCFKLWCVCAKSHTARHSAHTHHNLKHMLLQQQLVYFNTSVAAYWSPQLDRAGTLETAASRKTAICTFDTAISPLKHSSYCRHRQGDTEFSMAHRVFVVYLMGQNILNWKHAEILQRLWWDFLLFSWSAMCLTTPSGPHNLHHKTENLCSQNYQNYSW